MDSWYEYLMFSEKTTTTSWPLPSVATLSSGRHLQQANPLSTGEFSIHFHRVSSSSLPLDCTINTGASVCCWSFEEWRDGRSIKSPPLSLYPIWGHWLFFCSNPPPPPPPNLQPHSLPHLPLNCHSVVASSTSPPCSPSLTAGSSCSLRCPVLPATPPSSAPSFIAL